MPVLITARRGLTTLARHDHVPGKHPFRPLLSLVSGIGTEEKIGLTGQWSGYWGEADRDAQ